MASAAAASEYLKALHLGLKEMKDRSGKHPAPDNLTHHTGAAGTGDPDRADRRH